MLAATCAVSVLAGALFSLAGALQSSRVDLNGVLKGCEPTVSRGRRWRLNMRDMLIAVQVTLSVVLLVSVALTSARHGARAIRRARIRHPQCAQHRVRRPRQHRLRRQTDWRPASAVARTPAAIPGVSAVAFASHVPLLGVGMGLQEAGQPERSHRSQYVNNDVSPGFFAAFGIPLLRGRDFTESEIVHRAGVVIVSQTTARNLWPGEDAIGKLIQVGIPAFHASNRALREDVHIMNLAQVESYFLYLPLAPDAPVEDVFLRTSGDANQVLAPALRAASEIDIKLPSLANAHSMDDALWFQHLPSTLATLFAGVVGSMALFLAK